MNAPSPVPSGVLALVGDLAHQQREIEQVLLDHLLDRGFQLVHLPVLEYAHDESVGGYRFVDQAGRLVGVRTDFTPLAARMLAPCLGAGSLAVCYSGEVIRPRPVRLRQLPELYQLGFETYGLAGGGEGALDLTLELLALAGVRLADCLVSISLAGLGERVMRRVTGRPPVPELVELLRARDTDTFLELAPLPADAAQALRAALLGLPAGAWAEELGVAAEAARVAHVQARLETAGVVSNLDLAPRLAGSYYDGLEFTVWGRATQAVLAGGGEYRIEVDSGMKEAAGGCVYLGVALEERPC
ncbi:MAG TPA: ATP phosphoribosyltransferase regulatory subunit [Thermoanaerobaculaceae bacterium]|nr:ATP phosphoribosyltransferase regulatory subunit [Thermoanaerobaculaceae bacterium]